MIYQAVLDEAKAFGTIKNVAVGSSIVAVETEAGTGLAYVNSPIDEDLGVKIKGMSAKELAGEYIDGTPSMKTLALAAINSFLIHKALPDELDWPERLAGKKRLAMVGQFPMVPALEDAGIEVVVFELKELPGTLRPEDAADVMPGCDAVIITGATLANQTIYSYLPYISHSADAYLVGPSSPCADVLAERFSICSSVVTNTDEAFAQIIAGKCVKHLSKHMKRVIFPRINIEKNDI